MGTPHSPRLYKTMTAISMARPYVGGDTNYNQGDGYGTIFQVSPSGTFTTLHWFNGVDGQQLGPATRGFGLIQASDGDLYGVSTYGGNISGDYPNGLGTIFRISTSGVFTTLYNFSESDLPVFGPLSLVQGKDGSFYGTGSGSEATIFKFTVPLNPPPNQISGIQIVNTNVVITVPAITGEGYQLQYTSSLTTAAWFNVSGAYVSNSLGGPLTLTDVGGAVNTQRFYQVEVSSCAGNTFTVPVGFMQVPITNTSGGYDTMALPFQQLPNDRGAVTTVTGVSNLTVACSMCATANYALATSLNYLEFETGAGVGHYYAIASNDASGDITLNMGTDSLISLGVTNGDSYTIHPYWRIQDIFGPAVGGYLYSSNASARSDNVIIWSQSTQGNVTYWPKNNDTWQGGVNGGLDPVAPDASMLILRQSPATTNIIALGGVRTTNLVTALVAGWTLVGNSFPASTVISNMNLIGSGSGFQGSNALDNADNILVWNGVGWDTLWYKTSTGNWIGGGLGGAYPILPS